MSRKSHAPEADFVFLPLGGVGEIGMKLYLYGYGPEGVREWLIVDMGVTFGGETEPGVDVILPDIRFIEEERHNIAGLLLTHAHEDHFGAVADLWPALAGIPVYATPFTAEMLKAKLTEIGLVARIESGPFTASIAAVHGFGSAETLRTIVGSSRADYDVRLTGAA